ncbi:hypothetical protein DMC01_04285 [Campylobacter troglodytis]|nr:hypothetical protein DMC01_04285 [Campylobacter troglodytis]
MSRLIGLIKELEGLYDCEFLDVEFAFVADLSCGEVRGSASPSFVNEALSSISSLDSHNPRTSSTILKSARSTSKNSSLICKDKNAPPNKAKNNKNSQNTAQEKLYLLQVRPLVMKGKEDLFKALPKEALGRLYRRLENLKERRPNILGDSFIFGVMPDWNPAEMIGLRPNRLALSLYKAIITDNIWAYQRDNYGYKDLRSHPLMHSFLGMPYIDVRLSFNSFIPKDLNEKIASKLVNFYLRSLKQKPHLHDKIEFFIVYSCYDFNSPTKLKKLLNHGFNENELKRLEFALLNLTNKIINPENSLFRKDILKAKKLESVFLQIKHSNYSLIDKIYWLIEACKRHGTLPFAGVARAGFIAMQMLNSLVEIGFLSKEKKQDFLNSLATVSKKLSLKSANLNEKNKAEFLAEFGHLRAGSYNILSPRYDQAFDKYFSLTHNSQMPKIHPFALSKKEEKGLNLLLAEHGLKIEARALFAFFKDAIEGRESVKFEFTKLLSYAIELIAEFGEHYGIKKEDLAHLDIENIFTLYSSLYSKSPKERLLDEIKRHKEEYKLSLALKLPPLLYEQDQVYSFFTHLITPNFITQKTVTASVGLENEQDLRDKIVLIRAADPGYDYLFSKNIAGLITCYGGANSHMAIRASELNLPSVIGVGEEKFSELLNTKKVRIECASEQIICL